MKHTLISWFLFFATTISLSQDGSPNGKCKFQEIPSPPNMRQAGPAGINDVGAIVGTVQSLTNGTLSGYVLFHKKITTFKFPGSFITQAFAINNHAQIVGTFELPSPSNTLHGFVVHSGGFRKIDVPGAVDTLPFGINDTGDIVGEFQGHTGIQGFLLHNGSFRTITFPGAIFTSASGINNHGAIVGTFIPPGSVSPSHGFLLKNGVFTTINFPGATTTQLSKINDEGEIVGIYSVAGGFTHGFSLANGRFTTIDVPGLLSTGLSGLNNGDFVTADTINNNFATHEFVGNCQAVF